MSNCHFVAGRSLIDLATSRLALRAPALRAATALTRPNQSAQRLPCVRHAVPNGITVGPNNVVANHCVEHHDHLTHHRHDHDLRLLSGGREPIVESLERWIPIARAQCSHVEHIADGRAATPDTTLSFELAAFEAIWRDTDERSDLRTAESAELGQERNQSTCQYGADPRHRCEQSIAFSERSITQHDLDQALIDFSDVGSKARDAAARKTLQHRIFQHSGGVLGGDLLVAKLAADGDHFCQPFNRWRPPLDRVRRHNGHERRDHARVEAVVLGQYTAGLGKLPQLEWIDLAHRHAGREQGPHYTTLVSTTRLQTDRGDREAAQPLDQLRPTSRVITYRRALLLGQHYHVQTIFRHIDTAEREHCHLRIPFLLMRARARATVRVWKKRLELQAHSRFVIREGRGFRSRRGPTHESTLVASHYAPLASHKKAPAKAGA